MITAGLIAVIVIALVFGFFNGFHDAANSIATVVSTRVLTPLVAVIWAAFFNFIAFLIFGTHVASTIATGIVEPSALSLGVVFAALIGAIAWDVLTWLLGLPTSSSHALIGGLAGAAVAKAGWAVLVAEGIRTIAVFIVLSPVIGLLLAFTIMVGVMWAFHRVHNLRRLNRGFRFMQLVSAAGLSLGHGANDAQKTMGIILAVLIGAGLVGTSSSVPLWVVLTSQAAIGIGTATGGWRIIRTLGARITRLQPVGGMAAQTASAATLFFTAHAGIPVSTTHTVTGAVVGVGTTQRLSAVRWGVAGRVVWAWVLTLPGAFVMSWLVYQPFRIWG